MKKRIMLGKTYWLLMFLFLITGAIMFFICFPLVSEKDISIAETVKGIIVVIILALICFLLDEGLNASIKILGDQIVLSTVFQKKRYYKKDISILYAIHKHKGRGAYECPCLVIGHWFDGNLCYTKRKFVYDNCFLILLDYKKLKMILCWYNEEIKLSTKQGIEVTHVEEFRRFYQIIEEHNKCIQKD